MSNEEKKNFLSDEELEEMVDFIASETVVENDMRKVKEEVEVNPDAELEVETKSEPLDAEPSDLVAKTVDTMPAANVSLFDLDGDKIVKDNDDTEIPSDSLAAMAKDEYDLSDEDVISMLDILSKINKDPKYPVYKNLPEKLKNVVKEIAAKNNVPREYYNELARMIMMEFGASSEIESAFVDLERSLDMALNIPSVIDLYTEHTRTVMEENIPKMIEEIKDIDPDKAALLRDVKDMFTKSYTFSYAKEEYESNARVRKYIRKYDQWFQKSLTEFNHKNSKSNFKMNDITELPGVLTEILMTEPERIEASYKADNLEVPENIAKIIAMDITYTDIMKFCILICKTCENFDATNIVQASYMYYMMKNIIVLKMTNEAKTEFAAELINNICDTITFIRDKEAEFNAANMDKSKPRA